LVYSSYVRVLGGSHSELHSKQQKFTNGNLLLKDLPQTLDTAGSCKELTPNKNAALRAVGLLTNCNNPVLQTASPLGASWVGCRIARGNLHTSDPTRPKGAII